MDSIFAQRDYRHLFSAQLVALFGTGLTTVALGLLAYELAGADAAAVLGTALTIKMITYVFVAPIAGAYAGRLPRRGMLVTLDIVRACVVLALPFVDQLWQIYVLIVVLQSASAAFTPTFQAVLPDILPDERDYTRALSAAQLASTMESLLSPLLAAALLSMLDFHWLFAGTSAGFVLSAILVVTARIPRATADGQRGGIWRRTFAGMRIYSATPRLRGLMGLNLTVAAVGAVVMVHTVNYVRDSLERPQADVGWLLAANGTGTILVALLLPRMLERVRERRVMLSGGALLMVAIGCAIALPAEGVHAGRWLATLGVWGLIGVGSSLVLTPAGRILRRSSAPGDRPALFAAQFSLSHACWLISYPIAGWLVADLGFRTTWTVLGCVALLGLGIALACWPRHDPEELEHVHTAATNPAHLVDAVATDDGGHRHSHVFVIDDDHPRWPRTPQHTG